GTRAARSLGRSARIRRAVPGGALGIGAARSAGAREYEDDEVQMAPMRELNTTTVHGRPLLIEPTWSTALVAAGAGPYLTPIARVNERGDRRREFRRSRQRQTGTRGPLPERRGVEVEQRPEVPLGALWAVHRRVGRDPAMAQARVGLDPMVDAGRRQRVCEALLHLLREALVLDGARDVDLHVAHLWREQVRAVGCVGRQA